MEEKLKEAVKQLSAEGSHQVALAPCCTPCWPTDYPYDWKTIGYSIHKDGPNGRWVLVITPPTLDRNTTLAKRKRRLLKILAAEKAARSPIVAVYDSYGSASRVGAVDSVVTKAGFKARCSTPIRFPRGNGVLGSPKTPQAWTFYFPILPWSKLA